jgi:hypothetical protein
MRHAILGLAVLVLLPACKKGFGSNFEGEITMRTARANSPPANLVVKAKGDKLRFDTTTNGTTSSAIFDPQANKVTALLDGQKAYMDMDFSSANVTPNTDASTATIEKTGKTEKIAGLDCETWVAKDPSGKRSEVCIVEGLAFFDLEGLRKGGGAGWNKELRDKKMFPLRSVEYDANGKEISRSEAVKVEAKKLDDELFQVPKNYTKLPTPPHS